jgi:hypothetical protein
MAQFDNVFGIGKTIAAESEMKVNGSLKGHISVIITV